MIYLLLSSCVKTFVVLCRNCCYVFVCFVCFFGLCICSCNLFCFVNLIRAETVSCYFIRVYFLCVLFFVMSHNFGEVCPNKLAKQKALLIYFARMISHTQSLHDISRIGVHERSANIRPD